MMRRSNIWLRYGVAAAAVVAALVIKLLLVPLVTQDAPFLVFFLAVTVSAWFGGLGPGLLATALAGLLNAYYFLPPYGEFELSSADQQLRTLLFAVEGVLISLICARLKAERQNAENAAAQARELERQMLEISDAEQRRIGHDLHDGLGQHLSGIALLARRLEQHLSSAGLPQTEEASKIATLSKSAVEFAHDLCRSLSPPALERDGLAEALNELASNAQTLFGVECGLESQMPTPFRDMTAGVHLYRIAQEAISNAVKHGKATRIQLQLDQQQGELLMQILDNGTGIASSGSSENGMGLQIMRHRAKMIGARIEVFERNGGGTAVSCRYRPAPDRAGEVEK